MWLRRSTLLAVALAGAGCMDMDHGSMVAMTSPTVLDVATAVGRFDGAVATDLAAAPNVVEVNLEARVAAIELMPGHPVAMWTYDGVLPGPRIEAKVGDRIRVHFRNSLPEATTIHWHGLRVPAAMDGVPAVQAPVEPGDTHEYEFIAQDAGTFWYHPHVRSDVQVERGLYGTIVIRGADEPAVDGDHVVVLDDVLLDDDWSIAGQGGMMETMGGREGNLLLANGRANPVLELPAGGLQRLRFINAANARFFRIALAGHTLLQIGADGALFEEPAEVDDVLVVPGQRVDVLVRLSRGEYDALRTLPYERGHGLDGGPAHDVFQLRAGGVESQPHAAPSRLAQVEALPAATKRRELRLEERMAMGGHHGSGAMGPFSINGQAYPDVEPLVAQLGTVEEWSLVNTTQMDHPFHLHGFRFQVVHGGGVEPTRRAWRDTVDVPAKSTIQIRLRLDDHPGVWMFHCHILEHAEHGMMGELHVDG